MSIRPDFNTAGFDFTKSNDCVLSIHYSARGGSHYQSYDFLSRIMTMRTGSSDGGCTVVPFSQLDRESLEFMHAKLCKLKGNPPPLPALPDEKPVLPGLRKTRSPIL